MKKKIKGGEERGREGERKRKGENGVREGACRVRTGRSSTESQAQDSPSLSFPSLSNFSVISSVIAQEGSDLSDLRGDGTVFKQRSLGRADG